MYPVSARSQADMKYHNIRLVYDLVRNEGPISRATLAKRTGLSATSMTRIIGRLTASGLVAEHSVAPVEGLGRPGTLLDICAGAGYCLCIGATVNRSKVSIVDLNNRSHAYREILIPAGIPFTDAAEQIRLLVPELCREAGISQDALLCCGMSISGHVLNNIGYIAASSQFDWAHIDASGILENALHMAVTIENDCKAALIGEENLLESESRPDANIAYIKFGWGGVGSAAIVNGQVVRGSRNAAGEIGHFSAQPEGDVATYLHTGSFENVLSEAAVITRAQEIDPAYGSLERINAGLAAGDERLKAMMEEICEYIAIAVNDISCAYNPDTIVLNGSLVAECDYCYAGVHRYLKKRLLRSVQPNLTVRLSQKGTNASLYGIGCIAIEEVIKRLITATGEVEG